MYGLFPCRYSTLQTLQVFNTDVRCIFLLNFLSPQHTDRSAALWSELCDYITERTEMDYVTFTDIYIQKKLTLR